MWMSRAKASIRCCHNGLGLLHVWRCNVGKAKSFLLALSSAALFTVPVSAHAQTVTHHLTWTDNSDNETGFRGYLLNATGGHGTVVCDVPTGNVGCPITPFYVSGACFVVVAYNTAGESADSNTACVLNVPKSPSGVTIVTP